MNIISAKNYALKFLSRRMYTCDEIFDKLKQKGCEDEVCEQVIEEFCRLGYLDDRKYAQMYIIDSVNLNSKGMYRIKQELIRKGIARSIIDSEIENAEIDTYSQLKEYITARLCGRSIESRKDLEKLKAHLIRRGYNIYEINSCIREMDIKITDSDFI